MDAREFLQQAYKLPERINLKFERAEQLRSVAEKITTNITGMPRGSGNAREEAIANLIDAETEILDDAKRLAEVNMDINGCLRQLSHPVYEMIIESKDCLGKSFEETAGIIGYSIRGAYTIHNAALDEINKIKGFSKSVQ